MIITCVFDLPKLCFPFLSLQSTTSIDTMASPLELFCGLCVIVSDNFPLPDLGAEGGVHQSLLH